MKKIEWINGGLQQIGLGVKNNPDVCKFYTHTLGFNIPMFDETGTADIMSPYMGGKTWERHATFLVNLNGGGGMEIWQYVNREPVSKMRETHLGNLGILVPFIRCKNLHILREKLLANKLEISKLSYAPDGTLRCFVQDIEYNWACLIETNEGWFSNPKRMSSTQSHVGGVCGALIGVSDMEKSIEFYSTICGYEHVHYDVSDTFTDFDIFPEQQKVRRVKLGRATPNRGPFSHLLGESCIELIEAQQHKKNHLFKDRYWGDLGCIHLCFDMQGMDAFKVYAHNAGHPFTVDSGEEFKMDDAFGRFAYLEDPDGTLIEFVEVYKLPILRKYGIVFNMKKKKIGTPLSKMFLKALKYRKIK